MAVSTRAAGRDQDAGGRPTALVLSAAGLPAHRGLRHLLSSHGMDVVFATNADVFPQELTAPAFIVLDLSESPPGAIATLNRLCLRGLAARVVFLGAINNADGVGVVELNQTVTGGWLTRAWHVDHLGELEGRLREAVPRPPVSVQGLADGLSSGEIILHYQPIYDIHQRDEQVTALEALVRWDHPQFGVLEPAVFLPMAAEGGLMSRLAEVTIRLAAEQRRAWKRAGLRPPVAVKLGADLFVTAGFAPRLARLYSEVGLEPEDLILEVSEGGVMTQRPEALLAAGDLIDQGFRLVIDHFGRGSVSLAQLMTLRFAGMKLDQSLIRQVGRNERTRQLVRGLSRLAQDLGMRTAAQCVENTETLMILRGLGVDEAQGWQFGPPVHPTEIRL